MAVSPSCLCFTLCFTVFYTAQSLEIVWISKEVNEPNPSPRSHLPLHPRPGVNETVWGVCHHQAESHLTHCSQLVPSHLWLDTGGVPDPAEAVLEGSVLLQGISDLSDLTGLRFPLPLLWKIKRNFPSWRPSSVWKTDVPVDHTEGEGCRGMQRDASSISHTLCPCPSPVLCSCRLWLGCAPPHCPCACRHRRQLCSADKMLPTTESEQF